MTIAKPNQPTRGHDITRNALGRRMGQVQRSRALHGAPHMVSSFPLYNISLKDAADTAPLSKARKSGWGYPIIGGKTPALALLLRGRSGRLAYGGLIEGVLPRRLLRASVAAEKELREHTIVFQPRVLEVRALHVIALWLFAPYGKSRFIPIANRPGATKTINASEMIQCIKGALRRTQQSQHRHS